MEFPDEFYRNLCCTKTLYSTDEGFFKEFVDIMLEKVDSHWIENTFKRQVSEVDKIRLCCTDSKVWPTIQESLQNICKIYRKKCGKTARETLTEAELLMKFRDYKKAVMMYSQSIIRAPPIQPHNKKEYILPLAYKGRANAFFSLNHFQECISDLNMALIEGFPVPLKYQIFKQMAICYKQTQESNKAQISFRIALKLIDEQILKLETTIVKNQDKADSKKDLVLKKKLLKDRDEIKILMNDLTLKEGDKTSGKVPTINYIAGELPKLTNGSNKKYPNASNLVSIKQNAEAGRFAVAASKITAGSTLVVEEPYASALIPKMLASHCLHCFTRLFNPIPCKTCSGVAFCGTRCRDIAMASYHKYECEFLGLFMGSGMSILSQISLRIVTQEGLNFFKELYNKLQREKKGENSEVEFSEAETKYMKVYNLTTHSNLRDGQDYFKRALMAIFLVKCLKESTFFNPKPKGDDSTKFSEDEILTASIILHHLQLLQFNAHEIYETRTTKSMKTKDAKSITVAVGIYPTAALFNHECSPSVTRYFNGKNIVIKSARPLDENEVLSENYGAHYAKKNLMARTRELTSRYWFNCKCKACEEDWPTIENLSFEDFKILCPFPTCQGKFTVPKSKKNSEINPICRFCFRTTNVLEILKRKSKIQKLFDQSLNYMEEMECIQAIPLLSDYLDELFKVVAQPCREIFLAQEALRTCLAQTGNVWVLE